LTDEQQNTIENEAENLYGLIHARYLLTSRGLQTMADKFKNGNFGNCPRVQCKGTALLPVGLSDIPKREAVKLFCCSCNEIYHPRSSRHERTRRHEFCFARGDQIQHHILMYIFSAYHLVRADTDIDGAFFGASFAHLFFMVYPELRPPPNSELSAKYVPRVFGFKLHHSSHQKCMESREKQLQQQQEQQQQQQQQPSARQEASPPPATLLKK
jgi:casein kinase II subunit beta